MLTDEEILKAVKTERERFDADAEEIRDSRTRALDYLFAKTDEGKYRDDLPPEDGQSSAVSTDVSDAVETVLPDLMEIFTGGEDVVAFTPQSEEDEAQAEQETDYINYVFYRENPGWLTLYNNFKDALTSKTGIFKWWWEETEEWDEQVFEDKTEDEFKIIVSEIDKSDVEFADVESVEDIKPDEETGLYSFRLRRKTIKGGARVACIPPEDFMVDMGSATICDATWAGNSSRERVYDLIDRGFDKDKVALLKDYDADENTENERQARDFHDNGLDDQRSNVAQDALRRVEIREYHIWLDIDGKGVQCWQVITGNDDAVLLETAKLGGIQYAVNCPYPVTHQMFGRSLADMLIEVQKTKTALTRLMLNAYYFSVNPRPEVVETRASRFTIKDLMTNKPGRPYRVKEPDAVNWRVPPIVGDTVLPVLEYMSTVGEGRGGVVRNAQGLNPDTLHDTAKGAMELMNAAQRRVRMIARIFAETGVRDLFIGLHDLIVRHGQKKEKVRLRNEWVEVDPNKWSRRKDLSIDVGLGSNTKTFEMQFWQMVLQLQAETSPYGLADKSHAYNALKKVLQAGNVRNPELYFANPQKEGDEQPEQLPSPDMIKAQGELQLKQQEAQQKAQIEQARAQQDAQLKQAQFQFEAMLALYVKQQELGLAQQAAETERQLALLAARQNIKLGDFKAETDAQAKALAAQASAAATIKKADSAVKNVRPGGAIG